MHAFVLGALDFPEGRRSGPQPHSCVTHLHHGPLVEPRYDDDDIHADAATAAAAAAVVIRDTACQDAVKEVVVLWFPYRGDLQTDRQIRQTACATSDGHT